MDGLGYNANSGGVGAGTVTSAGSHGGQGGTYNSTLSSTYGSVVAPTNLGAGGGSNDGGDAGGGAVILNVAGATTNNGFITASGLTKAAGGSIYLTTGTLAGSGTNQVNGGAAATYYAGGGGGGRIALVVTNGTSFGSIVNQAIGAHGVHSGARNDSYGGGGGTIYLKKQGDTHGTLMVDNGNEPSRIRFTDLPAGTYVFDAILCTNAGILNVKSGAILDMSSGTSLATETNSSRLIVGGDALIPPADFVIGNAVISFATNSMNTWTANVTVANGGILTHEANAADESFKLRLTIQGNLTVQSGGRIDVVGKGYWGGPAAAPGQGSGGGHGGQGAQWSQAISANLYGSVTAPDRLGSSGAAARGGGAIVLNVSGATTNLGTISANGAASTFGSGTGGGGAGGSVYLTTATLDGGGALSADGGLSSDHYSGGGGGGRIAIILTNSSTFGSGTISAAGGLGAQNWVIQDSRCAAAGTVYLKASDRAWGQLIVDNFDKGTNVAPKTLIATNVSDAAVGDVVIRNRGQLQVASNKTFTCYGSWSNGSVFVAEQVSTVTLAGKNTATVYANNSFYNLTCTNGGKTIYFQAGRTNTVSKGIVLTGDANSNLVLRSTAAPLTQQWKLNVQSTATTKTFDYVDVQDSDARPSFEKPTPVNYVDSGNNSNWNFAVAGQTNYWTGGSNTLWSESANWSLNAPPSISDAKASLTNGSPRYPYLGGPVTIYGELEIESGASLRTSNQTLTVNGAATVAGSLIAAGTETLTFNSNLTFSGAAAFTAAQSTVRLAGSGPQSVAAGGNTFHILDIGTVQPVTLTEAFTTRDLTFLSTSAEVAFQGGFTVHTMRLLAADGATLTFVAGQTYTVDNQFILRGTADDKVVLTAPGVWYLNVNGYASVRHADVANSDADGGRTVYAIQSTNSDGNENWDFGAASVWTGSSNGDFLNSNNWDSAQAPGAGTHVVFDGAYTHAPVLGVSTTVARLTVGLGSASMLTLNAPLMVTGDALIGPYGTLRHDNNTTAALYRLDLDVIGDFIMAEGGAINVNGLGFAYSQGPGKLLDYNGETSLAHGGTHAGQGGMGYWASSVATNTYGSTVWPLHLGSGAGNRSLGTDGGGAVKLDVTGAAHVDGDIRARGTDRTAEHGGAGAGGSIILRAASITGIGSVSARGGEALVQNGAGGGGGRIALYAMGAAGFGDLDVSARGGNGNSSRGAAGTVFLRDALYPQGRVLIDNGGLNSAQSVTPIPPMTNAVPDELKNATVIATNAARLVISTNATVQALTVAGATEFLDLGAAGTVLSVKALSVNGTAYTKAGLYTKSDWNGFGPAPANVTGAGAIRIDAKGTVITFR